MNATLIPYIEQNELLNSAPIEDNVSLYLSEPYRFDPIPLSDGVYFLNDREYHIAGGEIVHEFNVVVDEAQLSLFGEIEQELSHTA